MRQPRDWYTSVQDSALRKMKRLGFSPAEIGEKIGRTQWSVRERAALLGMPWREEPGTSILATQAQPDMSDSRVTDARQRVNDKAFVRQLALAIQRGDHLPAGTVVPLTLIG